MIKWKDFVVEDFLGSKAFFIADEVLDENVDSSSGVSQKKEVVKDEDGLEQ